MSTLAVYKQKVTEKLAQTSTAFHSNTVRVSAINEAIQNLCEAYDIPDLMKKANVLFTNGVVDKPADYFRMIKLFTIPPTVNDRPQEYTYLIEDLFDNQTPTGSDYFWTEDFDIASGIRRLYITPNDTVTLTFRYVRKPTVLAVDGDESGLSSNFDDVIGYWACAILLRNERTLSVSQEMERKARELCNSSVQSKRKQGGVKQGERLRSRFEKYPFLNRQTLIN